MIPFTQIQVLQDLENITNKTTPGILDLYASINHVFH